MHLIELVKDVYIRYVVLLFLAPLLNCLLEFVL